MTVANSTGLQRKNSFLVWLVFPVITLGIYSLVWHYKVNNGLRQRGVEVSPGLATFALIIPIANFVTIFKTGSRLKSQGYSVEPWIGLLLTFVFNLNVLYYQMAINDRADVAAPAIAT